MQTLNLTTCVTKSYKLMQWIQSSNN